MAKRVGFQPTIKYSAELGRKANNFFFDRTSFAPETIPTRAINAAKQREKSRKIND